MNLLRRFFPTDKHDKKSIVNFWYKRTLLLLFILIGYIITYLAIKEYYEYEAQAKELYNNVLRETNRDLQSDVEHISKHINFRMTQAEQATKDKLKLQTEQSHKIFSNIYVEQFRQKDEHALRQYIIDFTGYTQYDVSGACFFIYDIEMDDFLFLDAHKNTEFHQEIREFGKQKDRGFWESTRESKAGLGGSVSITYAQTFTPYNWLIGHRVYINNIVIKEKENILAWLTHPVETSLNKDLFIYDKHDHCLISGIDEKTMLAGESFCDSLRYDLQEKASSEFSKNSQGFVRYNKTNLKDNNQASNIAYYQTIEHFDWIVAKGKSLAISQNIYEARRLKLRDMITEQLFNLFILIIMGGTIVYFIEKIFAKRNRQNFDRLGQLISNAVESNTAIISADVHYAEFIFLAQEINKVICHKKQVMDDLSYSKERLNLAFTVANEGLWDWDLAKQTMYFSPLYYLVHGYAPDAYEASPENWEKMIHPEDRAYVLHLLLKNKRQEIPDFACEYRIKRKDNSWVWVMGKGKVVERDKRGKAQRIVGTITDISRRKEAEEMFIASRALLAQTQEIARLGGWEYEVASQKTFWTEQLYKILELNNGFRPKLFIWHDFCSKKDNVELINLIKQALDTGKGFEKEVQVSTYGNKNIWIRVLCSPLLRQQKVTRLQGMVQDITARVQAEENLKISDKRWREAQLIGHIGNWEIDLRNTRLWLSEEVRRICGLNMQEESMDRKFFMTRISHRDRRRQHNIIKQALQNRSNFSFEFLFTRDDNSRIWLSTHGTIIYDSMDRAVKYSGTIQDVTRRRNFENDLRATRNYLESIINSMPSVIMGVDEELAVTQWNIAAERETGIDYQQAIGQHISKFIGGLEQFLPAIRYAIMNSQPQVQEKAKHIFDKSEREYDLIIYPLQSGDATGAVLRIDDVTEKTRLQEMIIQTEKMLSIGGLAAGMAHEINNPLGGILSAVQNARRRLSPKLKSNIQVANECDVDLSKINDYLQKRKIHSYIESIESSAIRASRIVSNMLNFSRKSDNSYSYADVNTLVETSIDLVKNDYNLRKIFDFRRVKLEKKYALDLPKIPLSITEIEQVILNILKNASQAMASQGEDHTPQICVETFLAEDFVVIKIQDNGPGMDEETKKRIFEPFFTTKDIGQGTGLGLSVSYFIITKNHRGRILIDSHPGTGSIFTIMLPIKK